jgi:hypothetical protein
VGLSWLIDDFAGLKMVHHGGTTIGFQAMLELFPERDMALCLLTNSDHGHELDRAVTEAFVRELLGAEPTEPELLERSLAELEEFAGRYEAFLNVVELSVEGGNLLLSSRPSERIARLREIQPAIPVPVRLGFTDEDSVLALNAPFEGNKGEFLRDREGNIEWFRWGGRIARRT